MMSIFPNFSLKCQFFWLQIDKNLWHWLDLFCQQISPGGGFGPVADDGYGVSYMVPDDHQIFFHISSKISSKQSNSDRFVQLLFESMAEIKELFETVKPAKKKESSPRS